MFFLREIISSKIPVKLRKNKTLWVIPVITRFHCRQYCLTLCYEKWGHSHFHIFFSSSHLFIALITLLKCPFFKITFRFCPVTIIPVVLFKLFLVWRFYCLPSVLLPWLLRSGLLFKISLLISYISLSPYSLPPPRAPPLPITNPPG